MNKNNDLLKGFTIVAPSLGERSASYHEAMVLGSCVWLWMQSDAHRNAPLSILSTQLLPALQKKQFVLMYTPDGRPCFYLSWAKFDEETEALYLQEEGMMLTDQTWCNGDRVWCLDFIAPFGHTTEIFRWLQTNLFPKIVTRFLQHRGQTRGKKIIEHIGSSMSSEDAHQWLKEHPIKTIFPVCKISGKNQI